MLDSIKEVFNMPIEEDKMDNITETSQKHLQDVAKGVKGKREEELKNAQKNFDNFMNNFPTNPNGLDLKAIEQATKKAIELDNNLSNATKRVEHINKVLDMNDLNSIVEEVINEVSNEWIKNKLKNVSKDEMDKRIKEREATAQAYNKSADNTFGYDFSGSAEKKRQKADNEAKKAERLKDIKKVAKPSVIDKAKETIGNFKKSSAEATKSVIDRAKEAVYNVGDSKVRDAGKAIKAEGKGIVDAVKQGVKNTIKGTVKGEDTHSASKSAIDRAKELMKKQEARKAENEEDKKEYINNKAKREVEREDRLSKIRSEIDKKKEELKAQNKESDNKGKLLPALRKSNEEDKNKDNGSNDKSNEQEDTSSNEQDNETKRVGTSKDSTKLLPIINKADDNKTNSKNSGAGNSEDDVNTSSNTEATGNGTTASNTANVSGGGKKNININQGAVAINTGAQRGAEEEQKGNTEGAKGNNEQDVKSITTSKNPDNTEAKNGKDNKPTEEDELEGYDIPKTYKTKSASKLREVYKKRLDIVAQDSQKKPSVSDADIEKMSKNDLLKAIFNPEFNNTYNEANKNLINKKKEEIKNLKSNGSQNQSETPQEVGKNNQPSEGETTPETPSVEGNSKTSKTTGEQTPVIDVKVPSNSSDKYKKEKEIEDAKKREERIELNKKNAIKLNNISPEIRKECKKLHEGKYTDETEEIEHILRVYNNKVTENKNIIDSILGEFDEDAVKFIIRNIKTIYDKAKGTKDQGDDNIVKGVSNRRLVELGDAYIKRQKAKKLLESLK